MSEATYENVMHALVMERVSAIVLDSGISIKFGKGWEHELRVETLISLDAGDETIVVRYLPFERGLGAPSGVSLLATLFGSRVTSAVRRENGELAIGFADGPVQRLTVNWDGRYESWTYAFGQIVVTGYPD